MESSLSLWHGVTTTMQLSIKSPRDVEDEFTLFNNSVAVTYVHNTTTELFVNSY